MMGEGGVLLQGRLLATLRHDGTPFVFLPLSNPPEQPGTNPIVPACAEVLGARRYADEP